MISERHRRRTFNCRNWPKTAPVDVDRLAADGFFLDGAGRPGAVRFLRRLPRQLGGGRSARRRAAPPLFPLLQARSTRAVSEPTSPGVDRLARPRR